jgi:DNA-binding NtrC family response regulator
MPRILVVDDEQAIRLGLSEILTEEGHEVSVAENGDQALARMQEELVDLVCTDVRMPGMDGLKLLARIKEEQPETEVIVITGHATLSSAVEAVKLGAHDYLSKPFELDEVRLTVRRALEKKQLRDQTRRLERGVRAQESRSPLIGSSEAFTRVLSMVDRIAPTSSTVLILGETGTGKELIAREIHQRSPRAGEMFIPINCGALPDTLLESELFGHAKGAFTGADRSTQGLFEAADRGTLFLDEIGNISLSMQSRLLRVLETGELLRLGERKVRKVDVRIVAATNADLKQAVEEGEFRQDFYYRLNVMALDLPPLRERSEDIPLLANHFLKRCTTRFGKSIEGFSEPAMAALRTHAWPGNIRELEHAIERATILCVTREILPEDLPADVAGSRGGQETGETGEISSLADLERHHVLRVLRKCGGHRGKTAEILGINRRTLYRKLIEYGVETGPQGED